MAQKNQNNPKRFIQYTSIPFEMFIIIFAGYKLGSWLDEKYPNEYQLYTLIVSLSAIFIAMFHIIRRVQKNSQ